MKVNQYSIPISNTIVLSNQMNREKEYIERINRVLDYIELNIDKKIDLDTLAGVACFSKYHFHRIFNSFTDETLYSFINRIRLERAAALLLNSKTNITNIAFSTGFNDSATFSRAFKKQFKISAQEWRKQKNSNINQVITQELPYNFERNEIRENVIQPVAVSYQQFPEMEIVYIRHKGSYAGNSRLFISLHKKLINWIESQGLEQYSSKKSIVIYHDPKGITNEKKLRISIGITVSGDILADGEIGKLRIAEGHYAKCTFKLKNEDYGKAWKQVYRTILPREGFQPSDGYCFEMYSSDCYNKEDETTTVDICVPIKRI